MRIAVIANGAMGGGVAARLQARGAAVFTSLAGRSAASRDRAKRAGIGVIDDDDALIERTDLFLSIVPPAAAVATAERFAAPLARSRRSFLYADCNAICPATARAIETIIRAAGAAFVDASIIGGPPAADGRGPRFYASGEATARFAELRRFGLDIRLIPGEAGRASALKMSYAALTKGLTALGFLAARGALAEGVAGALQDELATSQRELAAWLARKLPDAGPKAYRFAGEMEEIARFLGSGGGAATYGGAAETYRGLAALVASSGEEAASAIAGVFEGIGCTNRTG